MLPAGLGMSRIVYAREESWGFGPGGNETGVIIFDLPVDVLHNIEGQGITFLEQHVSAHALVGSGAGSPAPLRWMAPPVRVDGSDDDTNSTLSYHIAEYLNRYGFGIHIDKEVTRTIDNALSTEGNFVVDDGRRLIIIMPKPAKVVIAYRG
jgi:hypothetical protein